MKSETCFSTLIFVPEHKAINRGHIFFDPLMDFSPQLGCTYAQLGMSIYLVGK